MTHEELWKELYNKQVKADRAQKAFDRANNKYAAGDCRLISAGIKLQNAREAESNALQAAADAA